MADQGPLSLPVAKLVIAGWTGRDPAMVEHHIAELEAIGVARPASIPCFYRLSAQLLTTETAIEVTGTDSSGEVEFVLVSADSGLYVGLGSDHTDRVVESYGVTVSKQMCPKPVSPVLWRLDEVEDHWDSLTMRCWRWRGGQRALYQDGPVTRMLHPRDLMARFGDRSGLPVGTAMFCGTQPVIGALGFGEAFELELTDPKLGRRLTHRYGVTALPVAG